jgi:rhamnosyltransferase
MTAPYASVLLPARQPGEGIRSVLEAVFGQQAPFEFEVRIVDSGSTPAELELMRRYPAQVVEIAPEEFNHGRTRNLLASQAQGEALVFLTQDAEPDGPDWLATLVAPLADPAVAGVYSRQVARAEASVLTRFFLQETYPPEPARRRQTDAPLSLDDLFFSNVGSAIRREVWRQLPFPEVVMSEDQYWAAAALRAGYELVYEPAARVLHSHDYSLGSLFRRNVLSGASLKGLIADGSRGIARRGLSYIGREAAYLARQRALAWLPYMLLYEATKAAGFAWGFCSGRLAAGAGGGSLPVQPSSTAS